MRDDFFSALTAQVREEVAQNYFNQRRLIEEQIAMVSEEGAKTVRVERGLKQRVQRMYYLLREEPVINEFRKLADLEAPALSPSALGKGKAQAVRLIRVHSLTSRGKFRKLVFTAYERLAQWAHIYEAAHRDLRDLCSAVNRNIESFRQDFDLLTMMNFLRSLDVVETERKHFMGENFTARELASVDEKLMFRTISLEALGLLEPPRPPHPETVKKTLLAMADGVFFLDARAVRDLML